MVHWNDKERGYPISAGDAEGTLGLSLSCEAEGCGRTVLMRWADVLATWPAGTYTRDIAASLTCSACGARQGCVMAWTDNRPGWRQDEPIETPYPIVGAGQRKLL